MGGHGNKEWATLLPRDYDVPTSCIRIDLVSQEFDVRSSLLSSRFQFAICNIGKYVYAIGGCNSWTNKINDTCDKYDLLTDKWTSMPC